MERPSQSVASQECADVSLRSRRLAVCLNQFSICEGRRPCDNLKLNDNTTLVLNTLNTKWLLAGASCLMTVEMIHENIASFLFNLPLYVPQSATFTGKSSFSSLKESSAWCM